MRRKLFFGIAVFFISRLLHAEDWTVESLKRAWALTKTPEVSGALFNVVPEQAINPESIPENWDKGEDGGEVEIPEIGKPNKSNLSLEQRRAAYFERKRQREERSNELKKQRKTNQSAFAALVQSENYVYKNYTHDPLCQVVRAPRKHNKYADFNCPLDFDEGEKKGY